jgi:hypothetical protein
MKYTQTKKKETLHLLKQGNFDVIPEFPLSSYKVYDHVGV